MENEKDQNKKELNENRYNSSLEELEDLGFEILNNYKDENGEYGLRKISLDLQFYEGGGWCIDSCDSNGMNATLDAGKNLIEILPTLKMCRDLFLKTIKEIDKKEDE